MTDAKLLPSTRAYAYLPATPEYRRLPRNPGAIRSELFWDAYEDRILYYDCFWHHDGQQVLLVGPPPMNLTPFQAKARFTALPSGSQVTPELFPSQSTQITALQNVPADTTHIGITFGEAEFHLRVQPSSVDELAGHRVIFTTSKNNDLAWIEEWARYHARFHGATAVIFFDNGSKAYPVKSITQTLRAVPGIEKVAVQSWPFRYGAPDSAVRNNPYYVQFLQVSAMTVALRRYAARSAGLLNCDIDELVTTPADGTVFDLARAARHGLLIMRGQYIEPVPNPGSNPDGRRHRDFAYRDRDSATRLSWPAKWALDPTRPWVQKLSTHPYMHWVEGRPWFGKTFIKGAFYWHLRGISTNWKDRRGDYADSDVSRYEIDQAFVEKMRLLAQPA